MDNERITKVLAYARRRAFIDKVLIRPILAVQIGIVDTILLGSALLMLAPRWPGFTPLDVIVLWLGTYAISYLVVFLGGLKRKPHTPRQHWIR